MRRIRIVALATLIGLFAGVLGAMPGQAGHNEDNHSENLVQKTELPIKAGKDLLAQGSDLAFKGRLMVAGSYQGPSMWKIFQRKPYLKQIGFMNCAGGQGDVSVVGDYVFVSVDSPRAGPSCKPADTAAASQAQAASGEVFEGLHIIDISDPTRPKEAGSVDMPCGSHTHTLLPGLKTSYIYIQSYPLGNQPSDCTALGHRKVQIVEFPTDDPTKAKLLEDSIDVSPMIGCHEMTTFPKLGLMFGACINESRVWDISKDPTKPELIAQIQNPDIQIHHSTAVTWDGKYLVLGDEYAGAAGGGGCTGDEDATVGAAWIYDITDPAAPSLVGHHALPRLLTPPASTREAENFRCTNHLFDVIPMKDPKKYIMANSYYMGGIAVIDFSDPTDPTEIGYYVNLTAEGIQPDTWTAYWYNGRIYTNDYLSLNGIGAYQFKGTGRKKAYFFRSSELNPAGEFNPQVQIPTWEK
jgi:hypothetical protein